MLRSFDISTDFFSFFDGRSYRWGRKGRKWFLLLLAVFYVVRAIWMLNSVRKYDVVWLLREASPVGPPWIETIIRRVQRKPIVYEFDDAIWTSPDPETLYRRLLRCRWKVAINIRHAEHVIAGNEYLANFASRYNKIVTVIPTCVDVYERFNAVVSHRRDSRVVIGWTGSRSTNRYLAIIAGVLADLRKNNAFDLEIISDESPLEMTQGFRFSPWHPETEIRDLLRFDIGIMPLADTDWERGKCGFKLVQYMSLGIPVVASKVGHNIEVVRHGIDGYLCESPAEWKSKLEALMKDPELRARLGRNARARIEEKFSVQGHVAQMAKILTDASSARNRRSYVIRGGV